MDKEVRNVCKKKRKNVGILKKQGGGFPNPTSFVIWPSDFLYAKIPKNDIILYIYSVKNMMMTIINDDVFLKRMFAEKKLGKRFHKGRFLYINVWRNISDTPIGIGLVWHIDVNPLWHSIIGEMIIKIPNRKWSSGRVWRDLPGQTWWLHCHRLLWQSIQVVGGTGAGTGAGTGGGGQKIQNSNFLG